MSDPEETNGEHVPRAALTVHAGFGVVREYFQRHNADLSLVNSGQLSRELYAPLFANLLLEQSAIVSYEVKPDVYFRLTPIGVHHALQKVLALRRENIAEYKEQRKVWQARARQLAATVPELQVAQAIVESLGDSEAAEVATDVVLAIAMSPPESDRKQAPMGTSPRTRSA